MLAFLLDRPKSPEDWNVWSWHNNDHHTLISHNLLINKGVRLQTYILDPINFQNLDIWLNAHFQAHDDINGQLGTQSYDLSNFNPKDEESVRDFVWNHWSEHMNWLNALGVA